MAAHRIDFGNQADFGIGRTAGDFDRGAQPGATGADDGHIGLDYVHRVPLCYVSCGCAHFIIILLARANAIGFFFNENKNL